MSRCRASPRPKASSAWRSRPQAPSVAWRPRLETAILGLPFVECRAADPVLAAQVSRLRPSLLLPQNPDDLLFGEPTCLHVHPPSG
jgi:hypothetical protein